MALFNSHNFCTNFVLVYPIQVGFKNFTRIALIKLTFNQCASNVERARKLLFFVSWIGLNSEAGNELPLLKYTMFIDMHIDTYSFNLQRE